MEPRLRRRLHLATLLVGGSGVVYALMRHLLPPPGPYAVVNHPWQPHVQHLHVLVAPWLVWLLGIVAATHVRRRLARSEGCGGGRWLYWLAGAMIGSGVAIQVAVTPGWRRFWGWAHLALGLAWLLLYGVHLWAVRRRRC